MNSMHQSDSQTAEGQAAWADFGGGGVDYGDSDDGVGDAFSGDGVGDAFSGD